MRTNWKIAIASTWLLIGCAQDPSSGDGTALTSAPVVAISMAELPRCDAGVLATHATLSVEEVSPTLLVVRQAGVPLCTGTAETIALIVPGTRISTASAGTSPASSDPMPADEASKEGKSDPMPAKP